MKTQFKFLAVSVCSLAIGLSLSNFATSAVTPTNKIAVVDVQKVVSNSSQVNALKEEQKRKIQDVQSFIVNAKKSLEKETDAKKKKALEEGYNKELQLKTSTIEKEYGQKLKEIDTTISTVIANKAQTQGYSMVLAKGVVLYGGDDITDAVIKDVK